MKHISQSEKVRYDLTHMWNLRKKTEDHKGEKEKNITKRETDHKRLLIIGNKLRVAGGKMSIAMG